MVPPAATHDFWQAKLTLVHLTGDSEYDLVLTWAVFIVMVCLIAELSGST